MCKGYPLNLKIIANIWRATRANNSHILIDTCLAEKHFNKDSFSRNYATPLQESVSGMQWFLKMQTQNTDLFCAMQSVVHEIAMAHPRPYYKTITLEEGCN